MQLKKLRGIEVLDSRGNPTLQVNAETSRYSASSRVPSGASTGIHEALELRDKGKAFGGKGVQKCVKNIKILEKSLKGKNFKDISALDDVMIAIDGTKNKGKLGANTILGLSMTASRLYAQEQKIPLYKSLQKYSKQKQIHLPIPFSNIINGGKHAGNALAIQEFMIAPIKSKSFNDAVRMVAETYHTLKKIIEKKHGKNSTNVGDEGGFAPPLKKAEDALNLIMKAVKEQGYEKNIGIAIDAAASEFYHKGKYVLHKTMNADKLTDYYEQLMNNYPIVSLEDPYDQDDFNAWQMLLPKSKIQIVGDDLTVSNVNRIKMSQDKKLCDALLLKVNQIGSVSEAISATKLAYKYKWNVMVSHRSGETSDSFISDLSVGLNCGQIKLGAPCRGERVAKYNRLLEIEQELGKKAKIAQWRK